MAKKSKPVPPTIRMTNIKLINLKLSDIHPYEKNPRQITEKAIQVVMDSIKTVGYKNPIIVDKNNVVICGHTRLKALQKLQLEDEAMLDFQNIPCILADDLTKDEVKALRLIDNKASEFSLWDSDLLGLELKELENVDMAKFGFVDIIGNTDLKEQGNLDMDKVKEGKKCTCPKCGFEFEV